MIAHALHGSGLSAGLEAGIVIGGTAATCVVTRLLDPRWFVEIEAEAILPS